MAEKKKQHYVPKLIIRKFANAENKIAIFNVRKNKLVDKLVPFDTHCYTKYFYGSDLKWEKKLEKLEGLWSPIIHCVINNQKISVSDKNTLKELFAYQYLRTEDAVDKYESVIYQFYSKSIPIIAQFYGKTLNSEEIHKIAIAKSKETPRSQKAISNLNMIDSLLPHYSDLKLVILNNNTSLAFICSDNPIIVDNLFQHNDGLGINCAGLIMILPISTHKALMLVDAKIYDKINDSEELTTEDVININDAVYTFSREIIFSKTLDTLTIIKQAWDNKYIKLCFQEYFKLLNIRDPILINIEIAKFIKSGLYQKFVIVPKNFITDFQLKLSFLKLKKTFIPFANNINNCFFRNNTLEDLSFKFSFWNKEYCELIQKYINNKL